MLTRNALSVVVVVIDSDLRFDEAFIYRKEGINLIGYSINEAMVHICSECKCRRTSHSVQNKLIHNVPIVCLVGSN